MTRPPDSDYQRFLQREQDICPNPDCDRYKRTHTLAGTEPILVCRDCWLLDQEKAPRLLDADDIDELSHTPGRPQAPHVRVFK